jgi:hypothetical protein
MPESDAVWDFYWENHLEELQNQGKREAILAASRLVRRLAERPGQPVRLLELGCGEAQILGALVEGHALVQSIRESVGVDFMPRSLETCRRRCPYLQFVEGDFTDPELLSMLGQFEIVLLVNALHEVFSAAFSKTLGEIDVSTAKQRVEAALGAAAGRLLPGGYLVLFDGLESSGDIQRRMRVRFRDPQARELFEIFAREYHPFIIRSTPTGDTYTVELSRRDFNRYITKLIFLGKRLWQSERLESYQYFNEDEFRAAFARQGLEIQQLRTLTVDEEIWRSAVEIITPGEDFPAEHILIVAHKPAPA